MKNDLITKNGGSQRLVSLDALRGFDMFWIIGGEHIIHALAELTGWTVMEWLSAQMHHTVWNGCTFYDMIFPLFLFISGVSMPFSFGKKLRAAGVENTFELPWEVKKEIYVDMIRRTLILILLGMVVNGLFRFNGFENTRFASVLGRIGLAWFFAGLIYMNYGLKKQLYWFFVILIGYWLAMKLIPVPGFGAGNLTMEGSLESYIDRVFLPGRLHSKVHDPEGLLSTIPAIATGLLGIFTGTFIREKRFAPLKSVYFLLLAALLLILLGLAWDTVFPINKRLWTSSFVLFVGGYSIAFFALFYLIIDVLGWKSWTFPFLLIGMNSIVIYMAMEGLVNFPYTADFIFGGLINLADHHWHPLLKAVSVILIEFGFLYFLYRNKLFLKV
jgi:predicted acyltransferase